MSHPCRPVLSSVALYILLIAAPLSGASEIASASWADREQVRYTADHHALQQKEQQAMQAMQKAEAARRYAERVGDLKAHQIAEQAMATAERALQRARASLSRTEARLQAVERVRKDAPDRPVAVASDLKGKVEVKTAGGWAPLGLDREMRPGDEVRTGADGFAELMFNDGSRVNLHADSVFQFESANDAESFYCLSRGRLKAEIERLGQRRYGVRTPTAIAGVRGTGFLLETTAEGATALAVLRGEVEFGPAEKGEKIAVRAGERAILASDGTLRGPEPFDIRGLASWWGE